MLDTSRDGDLVLAYIEAHEDPVTRWCEASLAEIAEACGRDLRKDNGIRSLRQMLDKLVEWGMLIELRRPNLPRLLSRSQAPIRAWPMTTGVSQRREARRNPPMPEVIVKRHVR